MSHEWGDDILGSAKLSKAKFKACPPDFSCLQEDEVVFVRKDHGETLAMEKRLLAFWLCAKLACESKRDAASVASKKRRDWLVGENQRASKPPWFRNVLVRHPVFWFVPPRKEVSSYLSTLEPVVVVGRGHSGTRVVAWMVQYLGIDLDAQMSIGPSGDPVDQSLRHHLRVTAERSIRRQPTASPDLLSRWRIRRALSSHLQRRRIVPLTDNWGWKFPESYLTGPAIVDTFPRARFVHLIRDGRDVAFKRHLTDVTDHRLARRILRESGHLGAPHHLQAAASWASQVERFEAFAATLPAGRVLTIRYEELVTEPEAQLGLLSEFLNLSLTDEAQRYARSSVSQRDLQSHLSQDEFEVREVEALIAETLKRTGYLDS